MPKPTKPTSEWRDRSTKEGLQPFRDLCESLGESLKDKLPSNVRYALVLITEDPVDKEQMVSVSSNADKQGMIELFASLGKGIG